VHFATLRETVFQWQADEIEGPAKLGAALQTALEARPRLISLCRGAERVPGVELEAADRTAYS